MRFERRLRASAIWIATAALLFLAATAQAGDGGVRPALSDALALPAPQPADDRFDMDDDWFDLDEETDSPMPSFDRDRYESFNRVMFSVNGAIDRFGFDPFTRVYKFVAPSLVRQSIRNAFLNLDSPVVLVNAAMQRRGEDVGDTLARLVVNSTLGIGGLFDVAEMMGVPRVEADFGQTLASFGVDRGSYLVLPILGPSTVRDGAGRGVDVLFQPLTYIVGPLPGALVSAGRDLTRRETEFDGLMALKESSVDHYAAFRSAFLQDREAEIREGLERRSAGDVAEPAAATSTQNVNHVSPAAVRLGRVTARPSSSKSTLRVRRVTHARSY